MTTDKTAPEGKINSRLMTLVPRTLERSFRAHTAPDDVRRRVILFSLTLVPLMGMAILDYVSFGATEVFYSLLSARLSFVLFTGVVLFLLATDRDGRSHQTLASLWVVALVAIVLAIAQLRPGHHLASIVAHLALVLGIYLAGPSPLIRQVVPATLLSLGSIAVFAFGKLPNVPIALPALVTGHVALHAIGTASSRQLNRTLREGWLALRREEAAGDELRSALQEIRVLRGIIPLCVRCKRVPTDRGHWESVEAYVRDRTEADFSHCLCQECNTTLYPDVA